MEIYGIVGRVGADPEERKVGNCDAVTFSIPESKRYKDKQTGEWVERTEWRNFTCFFDATKQYIMRNIKKGDMVFVKGLELSTFVGGDGKSKMSITVDKIDRLYTAKPRTNNIGRGTEPNDDIDIPTLDFDDVPF